MAPLKILICGGGCAGPALALMLARNGHRVTIVERFPQLRAGGAQIDLRGQGIQIVRRLGLDEAVRAIVVHEPGLHMVDIHGNNKVTLLANNSGHGAQLATSEYELMRGDLVRLLYHETKDDVEYIFGKMVDHFEQDEEQVHVHFSDGTSDTFDILVGADGQGSRIRKAILPPDSPDPVRRLGLHFAYWIVPRTEADDNFFTVCHVPGGRGVGRRCHNEKDAQAYVFLRDSSPELSSLSRAPVEQQKELWTQKFKDVGWETKRFLDGMKTTENFYSQEVVQIHSDTWHKGRVVLLGDAAHCPSPFTGMGTTTCLAGAYVLAGEIVRNSEDLPKAFDNYEREIRPFVKEIQESISPWHFKLWIPDSQFAISVIHFFVGWFCYLRIPDLIARFSKEEVNGWKLPDYPELKLRR